MEKISICACWDGNNDVYDVSCINILYNSVKRNLRRPFDFVLYAGKFYDGYDSRLRLDKNIRVVMNNLPYWWCGMEIWAKEPRGVFTDTLLYIDLDVVIVGKLDPIVDFPSNHAYMKDYPADICPRGKENDGNASMVLIRNGAGHQVWDEYIRLGMPCWNPAFPPVDRLIPLAAQGIVNDLKIKHDVFPQDWVTSYKLQVLKTGLPKDCKAVSFHGRPKPHECQESWIKECWR